MPWLGFRRQGGTPWPPLADDPGEEAERFFNRMVGEGAWDRLTEEGRAQRRADGPALVADLRSMRSEGPPFDVTALDVPCGVRPGRPDVGRRITAAPSNGWAPTSPARSSTRSPTRSTARTCRTPTTSPRWRAW